MKINALDILVTYAGEPPEEVTTGSIFLFEQLYGDRIENLDPETRRWVYEALDRWNYELPLLPCGEEEWCDGADCGDCDLFWSVYPDAVWLCWRCQESLGEAHTVPSGYYLEGECFSCSQHSILLIPVILEE